MYVILLDSIISYGFKPCRYEPFTRKLEALNQVQLGKGNIIYIRNLELAQKRVASAPKFFLRGDKKQII